MKKLILVSFVLLSVILLVSALLYGAYRPIAPAETDTGGAESVDRTPVNDVARSLDSPELYERIPVYPKLDNLVVVKINVTVGEAVREGQILAELDDAPLLSDLRSLQEVVRLAEKNFREAAAAGGEEAERRKRVFDEARADLANVQMRVGYHYVVAPATGLVLEQHVTRDEPAARGVALFVISRPVPGRSPDIFPASDDRTGLPALGFS